MSSPISTILANLRRTVNILRSAVYAIDVRDDIADAIDDSADAIEQIYSDVDSASLREDAFAAALQEAIDDNLLPIPATVIDDNSLPGSKIQQGSLPLDRLAEPVQITVDSALSDSSTNPVQNKVVKGALDELNGSLYTETNIIEEEIIDPDDITFVNGNRQGMDTVNIDFLAFKVATVPCYLKKIDVRAQVGAKVQICLGTFRVVSGAGTANERGRFTKTQILTEVTVGSDTHAIYEPQTPIDIADPTQTFVLVCADGKKIGVLRNATSYDFSISSGAADASAYSFGVGTEIEISGSPNAYFFYFNRNYEPTGEEPTGVRAAYSIIYTLKESQTITTITNVKQAVKQLLDESGEQQSGGNNPLYGKKWAACGDSVTNGSDVPGEEIIPYANQIAERNGMVLYRDGIGGTTMMQLDPNDATYKHPFCMDRLLNVPLDCDYVTIWFGINDSSMQGTVGTINDVVPTTFYGAWNKTMNYLTENLPNAKIGIVVTHHCQNPDMVTAVREIAKKYGVKTFDIPGDTSIPYWHTSSAMAQYVDESIKTRRFNQWWFNIGHPNTAGHIYISYPFENWMRSL